MNIDEVDTVVCEIIAKIAKRDAQDLSLEHKLAEDLGMKSVSRIELAALLEDRLQVKISNFDIRVPKTVAEVIEMVKAKM